MELAGLLLSREIEGGWNSLAPQLTDWQGRLFATGS
jgi:hypothetical protein